MKCPFALVTVAVLLPVLVGCSASSGGGPVDAPVSSSPTATAASDPGAGCAEFAQIMSDWIAAELDGNVTNEQRLANRRELKAKIESEAVALATGPVADDFALLMLTFPDDASALRGTSGARDFYDQNTPKLVADCAVAGAPIDLVPLP